MNANGSGVDVANPHSPRQPALATSTPDPLCVPRVAIQTMKSKGRSGFSLLEVLLATGILLGAAIVLSELAGIGARQASAARDLAQAQLLCQSKLNEIVAGIAPVAAARDAPLQVRLAGSVRWKRRRPVGRT